jgi:glyoxylase-like metal-dependent hydrolase (beta-lactamase superfamily II)
MHGWRWIATPGHSPGHISLFRDKDRALIVGDAFVTTKQESMVAALLQPQHVRRPPAYFTPDWQSAHRSVIELTMLDPAHALAGHGRPMHGELLQQQLQALARGFARHSIPHHGRYSKHAAIADENGVVFVPPPVVSARTLLAGAAVVALAGFGLLALAKRHRAPRLARSAAISAILA